jgi:hypothetical protein
MEKEPGSDKALRDELAREMERLKAERRAIDAYLRQDETQAPEAEVDRTLPAKARPRAEARPPPRDTTVTLESQRAQRRAIDEALGQGLPGTATGEPDQAEGMASPGAAGEPDATVAMDSLKAERQSIEKFLGPGETDTRKPR